VSRGPRNSQDIPAQRPADAAAGGLLAIADLLGYSGRLAEKPPREVVWKVRSGQEVIFRLHETEIRVASGPGTGAPSEWGSLSYPDAEDGIRRWIHNHADRAASFRSALPRQINPDLFLREEKNTAAVESPRAGNSRADHPASPASWQQPPRIRDYRCPILRNRQVCDRHFLMDLEVPGDAAIHPAPGQFFHVVCDPESDGRQSPPLTLRRPLSVHRVEYAGFPRLFLANAGDIPDELRSAIVRRASGFSFLYRVAGEGTELLSRIPPGAHIDALGPLGNGFSVNEGRTAVIVSGGIGVAPLAALAETLRYAGKDVLLYLGAVRKEMLSLAVSRREDADAADLDLYDIIRSEFREIGAQAMGICTDDGSLGAKGLVTEIFEQGIRDGCIPHTDVCVYACGPRAMLRAVAEIAARNEFPCQVSLEERMACGVGACYACTCRTIGADGSVRRKRICRDGPVFAAKEIEWKD
jgi:dihydroorotate dehydrogenase electron transfer subunit